MTKRELVAIIAERAHVSKADAQRVFEETFELLGNELKKGEVRVDGFGTFKIVERKARTANNPRTGAVLSIPAKRVVSFKAAKYLKGKID